MVVQVSRGLDSSVQEKSAILSDSSNTDFFIYPALHLSFYSSNRNQLAGEVSTFSVGVLPVSFTGSSWRIWKLLIDLI